MRSLAADGAFGPTCRWLPPPRADRHDVGTRDPAQRELGGGPEPGAPSPSCSDATLDLLNSSEGVCNRRRAERAQNERSNWPFVTSWPVTVVNEKDPSTPPSSDVTRIVPEAASVTDAGVRPYDAELKSSSSRPSV